MREAIMLVIAILVGYATVLYCRSLIRKEKEPVLTTWLMFTLCGIPILWTYFHTHEANWIAYGAVIIGYADAVVSLAFVYWLGGRTVRFGKTQIVCLACSLAIFAWWYVSRESKLANLWLQLIMGIAYVPTYIRVSKSPRNTEDLRAWTLRITASSLGVVLAFLSMDPLSFIAASRSVINGIVILLLVYIVHRRRRAQLPTGSPA